MLTAKLVTHLLATVAGSPDVGAAAHQVDARHRLDYEDGTGAGQANALFTDTRTLTASATENIDLAGSLEDALGNAVAFTAVKAIRIRASAANTNSVIVGGAASNAFLGPFGDATDTVAVKPGGVFVIGDGSATGWAVTAGTGDILKVANSAAGTAVTYTIEIIGEVA
jgi:hypothetical protein